MEGLAARCPVWEGCVVLETGWVERPVSAPAALEKGVLTTFTLALGWIPGFAGEPGADTGGMAALGLAEGFFAGCDRVALGTAKPASSTGGAAAGQSPSFIW